MKKKNTVVEHAKHNNFVSEKRHEQTKMKESKTQSKNKKTKKTKHFTIQHKTHNIQDSFSHM